MIAMRCETKVFGNDEVPADEFDLLIYLWGSFDNSEFLAFAFWARVQCDFFGPINLVGGEGLSLMGFMSFLGSDFAFAFECSLRC